MDDVVLAAELLRHMAFPEGPARHLDASRQRLTPHCLAAICDSQLPSPELSLKMPPNLNCLSPTRESSISSFKIVAKANLQKNNMNNITIKILGFQVAVLLWGSRLHGFVSHRFFARISARIFCTDFLDRFFARIFCTYFLHGFLPDFFARISARIVCTDVCTDFCTDFLGGVPKHLLGSAKISPRKSPEKFTMLWGREGLGREEGEVRLWPA